VHRDVVAVLDLPEVRECFAARGLIPGGNTPEPFAAEVKRDLAQRADVMKQSNIEVD
jgi:tripartite-type tricarboxylate transporter receptor subunit TctC